MKACIGLCTYNGEHRLPETLDALGRMNLTDIEVDRVMVVDNASKDATAEVVRAHSRLANGLAVELLTETKPGKTQAMRTLFARTDEALVLMLDDDCLPGRDWARGLIGALQADGRTGIVSGPVRNQWRRADGTVGEPTKLAAVYRRSLGDQDLGAERIKLTEPGQFLMGASLGVRREAMEASGWLDRVLLESRTGDSLECGAEDAEVCIRIRAAGWDVVYEPTATMEHVIYAHRQTPEYLAKLRGAICRGEPALAWVAGEVSGIEEARRQAACARRRYFKTLIGTWNSRREVRVAERRGKMEGWTALVERLARESGSTAS